MTYEVEVNFDGSAEFTVEANSAEEAMNKARTLFCPAYIDEVNIIQVVAFEPEDDE